MTLDSSGNLGLGVTPSAWYSSASVLQVSGAALEGRTTVTQLWCNGYVDTGASGNFYINTGYASKYTQISGQHQWFTAPSGTAGNAISFTQAMTLDASGRLGIGTTSPSQKLEVAGIVRGEAVNVYGSTDPASTSPYLYSPSLGALGFGANSSERMRINSVGNVGIKTTSPNATLDIGSGDIYVRTGSVTSNRFDTYNGGATQMFFGFPASGSVAFNNGSDRLYISNTGNVGIGTTSPNNYAGYTTLTLDGSSGSEIDFEQGGTLSADMFVNTSAFFVRSVTAIPLVFSTQGSERMRITSGGNVGIGTTSPAALLHLAVASASVDGTKGVRITNPAGTIVMLECGSSNDSFVGTTSVSDFHIRTGNTERMRITSGGNVGIGTTSPLSILHILGQSGTTGLPSFLLYGESPSNGQRYGLNVSADQLDVSALGSSARIAFFTGGNASTAASQERMRITSSGNVEINTGSIKTGEPDTGYGRAAFKIGTRQSGTATDSGGYIPISIDGTVYFINLYTSTP